MKCRLLTTQAGRDYADEKRIGEHFEDELALVMWVTDAHPIYCFDKQITSNTLYMAFAITFRHHYPEADPPVMDTFLAAIAEGYIAWAVSEFQTEMN